MSSPCQDCPHRKLTCHDRCDEYMAYHDALVAAKDAVKLANKAVELLADGYYRRRDNWFKGGNKGK